MFYTLTETKIGLKDYTCFINVVLCSIIAMGHESGSTIIYRQIYKTKTLIKKQNWTICPKCIKELESIEGHF